VERRRRLARATVDQNYAGDATVLDFLPLQGTASAEEQGLLRGIRVKINFEMIDKVDKRACYTGDSEKDEAGGKG
jgi:hypothetical protein